MASRQALVVVDVLAGIFELPVPLYRAPELQDAVASLIGRARAAGAPIVHVRHRGPAGTHFAEGAPGRAFVPASMPRDDEVVVDKEHPDAFQSSRLESVLRERDVGRIVVCGFASEACIDTTVRSAYARGLSVVLAAGAHTTTDNAVLPAASIVAHHERVLARFATVTPHDRIEWPSGLEAGTPPSVEQAYDRWASSYDADDNATRDLDARVLRGLLPELGGRDVLELGCGTGKNTVALAQARSVVAVDLSRAMMARARARLADRETAAPVCFLRVDARDGLPFRDGSFDLVTADLVLEHLADVAAPLREIARVLRPGGLCLVVELHPYRQLQGKQARFSEREAGETVRVPAFAHPVSEHIGAALAAGLRIEAVGEWQGPTDATPRLLSVVSRRHAD